jgi:hypothetical protein
MIRCAPLDSHDENLVAGVATQEIVRRAVDSGEFHG